MLRLALALSLALALINHVLAPKAFAATQLLFDYQFGLIRRGLAGELLRHLSGGTVSIHEIYAAAALVTLSGILAFALYLWRYLPRRTSGYLLLVLAFNSFAFASFAGNTGYLDGLLMLVAVAALFSTPNTLAGLALRLVLCAVGVLVHENMLPYFAVLIGLDLWLRTSGRNARFAIAASPVLAALAVLAILVLFAEFTPEQATDYAQHLQARAGFALDANSTDVAGRSIGQNLALMEELRGTRKYWTWVLFDGVPLFAMSLWLLWLAGRVAGNVAPLTRLFIAAAILSPLSLNLIAFDVVRFGAASVLAGFLVIGLLLRSIPGAVDRLERTLNWPHFLIVLVLNANMFTIGVNIGAGHTSQFPWVLLTQWQWFLP